MAEPFPIYRRTRDGRHFYRIESERAFTEVHLIGARAVIHRVSQAAYPEQVRIAGLIGAREGNILPSSHQEFQKALDLHEGR